MSDELKFEPAINYTSREFHTIREDLLEHVRRYYPLSFRDFSSNSFGSLMVDTVAYVGDILSFYLDYQANECFLDTAIEYGNVLRLSQQAGYHHNFNPVATGVVAFYVLAPAKSNGIGVDEKYIPILKRGNTAVTSNAGVSFMLTENVDFSLPNNEVVVAKVNSDTGAPTHYAIKGYGRVVSGEIATEDFIINEAQRFKTITLNGANVTDIISVTDSGGHIWHEVEYLSQDVVYNFLQNTSADKKEAPYILKPIKVPRRFIARRDVIERVQLIFGHGSDDELSDAGLVHPENVVLNLHGKNYIADDSFDPNKLIKSNKFGVAPANTTLTVVYRINSITNVNTAARSVTKVTQSEFDFPAAIEGETLVASSISDVVTSLQCDNENPIVGSVRNPTTDELRFRTQHHFATQNRAVTLNDYKSLIYKMSGQFGSIKRCHITQDADSFRRNLNIYVISEDFNGKLIKTPITIKNNLKTWLNQFKMINDTIDILDAKIVNLGIEFELFSRSAANKYAALEGATSTLEQFYSLNYFDIGESFNITEVYQILNSVEGITDTTRVKILRKDTLDHSSTFMDIEENLTPDGRAIKCPANVIFEIKFPKHDIRGTVK